MLRPMQLFFCTPFCRFAPHSVSILRSIQPFSRRILQIWAPHSPLNYAPGSMQPFLRLKTAILCPMQPVIRALYSHEPLTSNSS